MKNYYVILGVDPDASLKQIREAFRRQAKELHPDYYGQDCEPFIALQEAYSVLSDPARRRDYDKLRRPSSRRRSTFGRVTSEPLYSRTVEPEPLIPDQDPSNWGAQSFQTFTPSFEELFDRLWRNFSLDSSKVVRRRNLDVIIRLSAAEALRGGRATLMIPARLRCPACGGRGGIGIYACGQCAGTGAVTGEYPVTLTYPPGVTNNYTAEIPLDQFGMRNYYLRLIFKVGL